MTAHPPTSFPKDRIKILLLENIHATAHEIFHQEGYQVEALSHSLPVDELAQKIADVHILGIRSKTQLRAAALAGARRLLTVGCFCIGTNQVDLDAANRRGVPVFNAPGANANAVKELVIAGVLLAARNLVPALRFTSELEGDDKELRAAAEVAPDDGTAQAPTTHATHEA